MAAQIRTPENADALPTLTMEVDEILDEHPDDIDSYFYDSRYVLPIGTEQAPNYFIDQGIQGLCHGSPLEGSAEPPGACPS